MNFPRAPSHMQTMITAITTTAIPTMSAIAHGGTVFVASSASSRIDRKFTSASDGLNRKLNPPPPESNARNAANPITNHFARSNGSNRIRRVSSYASPKGAKISILRSAGCIAACWSTAAQLIKLHLGRRLVSSPAAPSRRNIQQIFSNFAPEIPQ
jgi:hypothetical protein